MASGRGPVRRAQLIAPFGVGAMLTTAGGASMICAGLDYWFASDMDPSESLDESEYELREWRLEKSLGVGRFMLPPDYRDSRGSVQRNLHLTVPFFRFPRWSVCPRRSCRRMEEIPLTARGPQRCRHCEQQGRKVNLVQVPFVAMCSNGHLQDFPWREWVHRSVNPTCKGVLRLRGTGGTSLAAQKVECECGVASRSLAGITSVRKEDGVEIASLSADLDPDPSTAFLCQGHKPWLGKEAHGSCGAQLRGSLRNASNVYFADVRSAIFLPRTEFGASAELLGILDGPAMSSMVTTLLQASGGPTAPVVGALMSALKGAGYPVYSEQQVGAALASKWDEMQGSSGAPMPGEEPDDALRRGEFDLLRDDIDSAELRVVRKPLELFGGIVSGPFARVCLATRLKETRVLAGFARVEPISDPNPESRKALLWHNPPSHGQGWLPAYEVFGEGIYLELDEDRLKDWERIEEVRYRADGLAAAARGGRLGSAFISGSATPRYLLLHTLSHLLMNGLTFECGYSTAALRERLYVCDEPGKEMAGILIYTASGDAEGTLGGLVRMAEPAQLEQLLGKVLEAAQWCAADPVCMESGPQGPDSCNLAACHNCSLVPETACEAMNRFLDRGLVVGTLSSPGIGFFDSGSRVLAL